MKTISSIALYVLVISIVLSFGCQSVATAPSSTNTPVDSLAQADPEPPAPAEPAVHRKIQLAFCLDATGSMSELIAAAKEKIWSITSSIAQSDSTVDLEIAFVFYRDRGDVFVTRLIPLSQEIDSLYSILMDIEADGGGDLPESVNEALHVAVNKLKWDGNDSVYKTIFLVGDCPPHMNYHDDVKYPVSCAAANKKGITINTILMGENHEARRIWNELKNCSNGSFMQVGMNANNFEIGTPYDDSIDIYQRQLDDTRLYYGYNASANGYKHMNAEKISKGSTKAISAKRAEFYNTAKGEKVYYGTYEWINDTKSNSKLIDTINVKQLPDKFKGMTREQIKAETARMIAERNTFTTKIKFYTAMRDSFIKQELEKKDSSEVQGSFNNIVFENIKSQAADKKIILKGKAKF